MIKRSSYFSSDEYDPEPWMRWFLLVLGWYSLAWAALLQLPSSWLESWRLPGDSTAIVLWHCWGAVEASVGLGCLWAARDAYRLWPFACTALMKMTLVPAALILASLQHAIPAGWLAAGIVHDLLLAIPLTMICWGAIRYRHTLGSAYAMTDADDPLRDLRTNTGRSLDELANAQPQMIVFLRHAGCTFCRQSLADLSATRREIEHSGVGIVLIHLGEEEPEAIEVFERYQVADIPRIADPECRLYRQFGLDLGGFAELFGLRVWLRGLIYGIVNGHGIGAVRGNSFQMPGVYLYHCGTILDGFRHDSAADRPDYIALAHQIQLGTAAG